MDSEELFSIPMNFLEFRKAFEELSGSPWNAPAVRGTSEEAAEAPRGPGDGRESRRSRPEAASLKLICQSPQASPEDGQGWGGTRMYKFYPQGPPEDLQ